MPVRWFVMSVRHFTHLNLNHFGYDFTWRVLEALLQKGAVDLLAPVPGPLCLGGYVIWKVVLLRDDKIFLCRDFY